MPLVSISISYNWLFYMFLLKIKKIEVIKKRIII